MEWSTHCLSGMVAGHLITGGDWRGAIIGGIAAVIPDLDEPKSKVGRLFWPVAYPINKVFGHRTITHSLLFAVLTGMILYPFTQTWVWLGTSTGILAHILGDMLTGRVKFFYPAPKFIGISTNRMMFIIIDRITAILALWYIAHTTISTLI
ncbi:metal-dependent hydrolase [Virgibacillus xinjiangensis]|uniref:Metal-dependent hydrolase n=1 Tax=Virgibacillus xinjiangensis TaxID=393090 RepID=A0ABV7CYM4_9BACI